MEIKPYLKAEKERIDTVLERMLPSAPEQSLAAAFVYSLRAGGKRLRPILALTCGRACGVPADHEAFYRAACALELIHTYTLIHDDLPVMDNDDFRRGLPTCHRQFGVRRAVLAGVALHLEAFAQLDRAAAELGLSARERAELIAELARAAGGGGVVGGQVVDLESEGCPLNECTLRYIHRHKTGALIRVSCTLGGRLARAGEPERAALAAYGEEIGLAFQIIDDLLDVEGDFAVVGKGVGTDQARGKLTFPALYGIEHSRRLAAEAVGRARAALERAGLDRQGLLAAIAGFILSRKS